MSMHPRSLIANIVSGTLTAIIVIGLGYFIYEKQDSFSLFAPSGKIESDFAASPKPIASERIDEEQVENEMNRIAEEKRKVEEKRRAEEARKKAEAEAKRKAEEARKKAEDEKKRLAELEAKKKAEAAEQKRLDEIALKKKLEEEKKKKDEEALQQKLAEEKKEKQKQEEIKKKEEKAIADKKAAADKQKAEEAKKAAAAAAAKAKADADAKAEAAENDRIANAYLGNASFVGALQQALYDNWVTGMEMIGYTATVVFYVDQQGNIIKIDKGKSTLSGFRPFDDSVIAAVEKTKRIKMPDNKHAVNKLVKEGVAVTFDPKDVNFKNF
ncbi:cell envelope integrity protein TolA [Wohlfahrtiimonas populi]|uniref:cell envelope integrity protein TolA n=1 Tax=Wohlfahrtiimonas populi TaxID=1940240 RepID=UPI00098D3097|nr:cell envelope integrity protein TolA [Wohlfahrtiimonas populi]